MFPAIDHRAADLADNGGRAVTLPRSKKRFDNLLSGAKIFAVGSQNTERESRGLVPVQVFDIEIEEKLGLLAALFELEEVVSPLLAAFVNRQLTLLCPAHLVETLKLCAHAGTEQTRGAHRIRRRHLNRQSPIRSLLQRGRPGCTWNGLS